MLPFIYIFIEVPKEPVVNNILLGICHSSFAENKQKHMHQASTK